MAFCRVVFPLLVLSVISCYASTVPVFLWGDLLKSSEQSNPMKTISSEDFKSILHKELKNDPLTIVFIEEALSVEDFSLKNDDGESFFPYLQKNIGKAIYLPSVDDAVITLKQTAPPGASATVELTENGFSEPVNDLVEEGAVRFIFINLHDAQDGVSRAELLRRHNDFMEDFIPKIMAVNSNVVAVYTGNFPSWTIPVTKSRVRRAAEGTSHMYQVDGLRMIAKNIHMKSGNDTRILGDVTDQNSVLNTTSVNATMTFDNTTLTLNFNSKGGYWFFDTVVLTMGAVVDTLYPDEEVFAILGFSYRCAQYVSFSSRNETKTYTISFEDLKIQPFFETNTTQEFGDSFNCVGFFSAPIWAGLFVVFILLSITFYGIMMMLDIRTMDRFDDPKGKTITINAE